ncbi:MAG: CvpA family protein [Bacteroidetes bacterium]|nr:MAG: CvpA family protein [Bacteroidota bacterium]
MNINLLDLILLIPLLLFAFNGYKKGIIIEVTTLVALVLGIYAALFFSNYTANLLTGSFNISTDYLNIIAFIATFIGVLVAVMIIGKLLEKVVNLLMLGIVNKLAGALFGIVKGALLLSILIFLINYFDTNASIIKKEARTKSILYKNIEPVAPWIYEKFNLEKLKENIPDPKDII